MKTWKRTSAAAAVALMASAGLAACGDAPEEGSDAKKNDYLPCIVSDAGGFNDKSFNQLSYEGVKDAAAELNSEFKEATSKTDQDYAPNLENLVAAGCDTIVTVGFALATATKESAAANPEVEYILIDDAADGGADGATFDGKADQPNIKPILYNTAQAAFLAGYAAADYTKTGVVGTYGGLPFPTVTIFMDGFKQGVDYYAETKKKAVKVVGFTGGDKGAFTGGFDANEAATNTANQILDQKADVILPVGGPIYQGALTAIGDKDIALVGVDADFFETDPNTQDVIFTSILKNMKQSTKEAILAAGEDKLDFTPYVGTLENDGVGIAPFHNFESKISDTLVAELETVKAGIIDGSIPVNSYLK
ncbi:MAG: BMP family ABC transporter substrate-binding protein [Propionibacteriales bacterium]|nr:BMP family ABC transporter substrate-binding protein [Propionibacteriales bacterium]